LVRCQEEVFRERDRKVREVKVRGGGREGEGGGGGGAMRTDERHFAI
jgi:hypothetical protein